ncbi:hypothetical protein Tco_1325165, partial [Tanacetum coccineum]
SKKVSERAMPKIPKKREIDTLLEQIRAKVWSKRGAAEKAYDVAKVDERVNKAVAASNRSANAARVAAVKAVQKQRPQRPNKSNGDMKILVF